MRPTLPQSVLLTTLLLPTGYAAAQVIEVPRPAQAAAQAATAPAPGDPATAKVRAFDYTHLKDRPYDFDLPKPAYPSTPRVQREFVVEYLYDYALSTYTPPVPLPILPAGQGKRSTPEDALLALYSAMRRGDYAAWVQGWDDTGKKQLAADAKEKKQDAAFWIKLWQGVFASSKGVVLIDRVETASQYVLLDVQLPGTNLQRVPSIFKLVNGEWLQTNDLSNNPIVYALRPDLAGVVNTVPPVAANTLDTDNTLEAQAQAKFLAERARRDRVIAAGK